MASIEPKPLTCMAHTHINQVTLRASSTESAALDQLNPNYQSLQAEEGYSWVEAISACMFQKTEAIVITQFVTCGLKALIIY